mmetsp:Transcript_98029/g.277879  ORF Transcript_98029/g.277879 Transcript_98029/m.277879 type:complete len:299 (-) Transcript_98029:602-1498(-)
MSVIEDISMTKCVWPPWTVWPATLTRGFGGKLSTPMKLHSSLSQARMRVLIWAPAVTQQKMFPASSHFGSTCVLSITGLPSSGSVAGESAGEVAGEAPGEAGAASASPSAFPDETDEFSFASVFRVLAVFAAVQLKSGPNELSPPVGRLTSKPLYNSSEKRSLWKGIEHGRSGSAAKPGSYRGFSHRRRSWATSAQRQRFGSWAASSRRSFSQLPRKVVYRPLYEWYATNARSFRLYSKCRGYTHQICAMQSRNCMKTGAWKRAPCSFLATSPCLSVNLCPSSSQSFSTRSTKPAMVR